MSDNNELDSKDFGVEYAYMLDRDKFADTVVQGLSLLACDEYGCIDQIKAYRKVTNGRGGVTTGLFEVNPYWWGTTYKPADDPVEKSKPNFIFNGTDDIEPLGLKWYKFAPRGMFVTRKTSITELTEIFKLCAEELVRVTGAPLPFEDRELVKYISAVTFENEDEDYANVVINAANSGDEDDLACDGYGYVAEEDIIIRVNLATDGIEETTRWFAYVSATGEPGYRVGKVHAGYRTKLEAACAVARDVLYKGYAF